MSGLTHGSVLISLVAVLFAVMLVLTIPLATLTQQPAPAAPVRPAVLSSALA